jgi:glycosyltransferase involved in cell wall biosynthesis
VNLTILSVAYPLAPVGPDAVGGAEQVLSRIDQALVEAGHRSIVIAREGSTTAGTLVAVPAQTGVLDAPAQAWAHERQRHAIIGALHRWPVDVVHLHGVDFHAYLPPPGAPVLVTLHLPVSWYPPGALAPERPDIWFQCVSRSQHETCPIGMRLLPPIENGVPLAGFAARHTKRRFALFLGRICREKGVHVAIEAARRADMPLLIAGEVFPYDAHRRYFEEEVKPRLDARRRFIGPVGFARKRRLLTAARCLLVPSLAPETSSLVAREALACGTPVVGYPRGELPATIEHGRTGFLTDTVEGMADAIHGAVRLRPEECRAVARERFCLAAMIQRYFQVYASLAGARSEAALGSVA